MGTDSAEHCSRQILAPSQDALLIQYAYARSFSVSPANAAEASRKTTDVSTGIVYTDMSGGAACGSSSQLIQIGSMKLPSSAGARSCASLPQHGHL